MKYFEKLAKEDKGYTGAVIGGGALGGLAAGRAVQAKDEIKKNLTRTYKQRRVSGNPAYNKMTRKALKGGAKAGLGLAVGGAAAIGAGVGHLFD
jgi:hypothetical protein